MIKVATSDRYRFVIGGLSLWAHLSAGLSFTAVSPILPLITDDYGLSHTTAGLLVGVAMIVFGALSLPGGVVAGRLGPRRAYALGWLLVGVMSLSALSPGFAGLLALRIVYGLGMAAMIPAAASLVMQWFSSRERLIVTSLNIAFLNVGMVLSASTAAPIADIIGWEKALGSFGGIGLTGAFAWLLWGKSKEGTESAVKTAAWGEIWAVLRNRTVLLMGAADASCFSMYIVLTSWLPTFYNETRGTSLTEGGLIISLFPFMGIFAVLLGGFLPLKMGSKRLFLIVPGTVAAVGGLGTFLIDNTAIIYISAVLVGLGCRLYIPVLLTLPMELPEMTPQRVAFAWGWVATASGMAGFTAPFAAGGMRDALDTFVPGFLVFTTLAWFLVVAGFLLPTTGSRGGHLRGPAPSTAAAQE